MRVCRKCDKEKRLTAFPFKNKAEGTRGHVCKACHRKYSKKHYAENSDKYKAKSKRNSARYLEINRRFVWKYLTQNPCVDCGETDPVILEFDHVKGKTENIAEMMRRGFSLERLKEEIALCDVRCANCHVRKTATERGWWKATYKLKTQRIRTLS